MSTTDLLIQAIEKLPITELDRIFDVVRQRRRLQLRAVLDEARGSLKGAWGNQDAQEWIDQERAADDDRS